MHRKQFSQTTNTSEFQDGLEVGVDKPVKVVMMDIEDLLIADGIDVINAKEDQNNITSYNMFKEWFQTQSHPIEKEYDSNNFKTCNTPPVYEFQAEEKSVRETKNSISENVSSTDVSN